MAISDACTACIMSGHSHRDLDRCLNKNALQVEGQCNLAIMLKKGDVKNNNNNNNSILPLMRLPVGKQTRWRRETRLGITSRLSCLSVAWPGADGPLKKGNVAAAPLRGVASRPRCSARATERSGAAGKSSRLNN